MAITKYENKTLTQQSFTLEESFFVNCVLKECDLFYSGGDFELVNTRMDKVQWHFRGPALKTIQMAQMFGMLNISQAPPVSPVNQSNMN